MRALDIVRTPKGGIALVTETVDGGSRGAVEYLANARSNEKNAWWDESELEGLDSLPHLLAVCTAHPFGSGKRDANEFYPPPTSDKVFS